MLRRIVIVAAVLFSMCFVGFVWLLLRHWHTTEISDASKPTTLLLEAGRYDGWPMNITSGIAIQFQGELDGEAEVTMQAPATGEVIRTERLKGNGNRKVDFLMGGDWFERECVLHYQPLTVISGKLTVRYAFD